MKKTIFYLIGCILLFIVYYIVSMYNNSKINKYDSVGYTKIMRAAEKNDVILLLKLIKKGEDPLLASRNYSTHTALAIACERNNHATVNILLPFFNNASDSIKAQALLSAAFHEHFEILKSLFDFGFNPNILLADGDPILYRIAPIASPQIFIFFQNYGAYIQPQQLNGRSLLTRAAIYGNLPLVNHLISEGITLTPYDLQRIQVGLALGFETDGKMDGKSTKLVKLDDKKIKELLIMLNSIVSD